MVFDICPDPNENDLWIVRLLDPTPQETKTILMVTGFKSSDDAHKWILAHLRQNREAYNAYELEREMALRDRALKERELRILASRVLETPLTRH